MSTTEIRVLNCLIDEFSRLFSTLGGGHRHSCREERKMEREPSDRRLLTLCRHECKAVSFFLCFVNLVQQVLV